MGHNTISASKGHPLAGNSFEQGYLRAAFLSSLCSDYAHVTKKLVDEVMQRADPYRGNDAEILLAVSAARNVERIAIAVRKTATLPALLRDAVQDQLGLFESTNPDLTAARNIIEHVDEYINSTGRDRDDWFDITKRVGPNRFLLRIGGHLDIEMIRMAASSVELAEVVRKAVFAWGGLELRLQQIEYPIDPLIARGISTTLEEE